MKFKIPSKKLYNAAAVVNKVIASKSPLQILNNFLITLHEDGFITIEASDVDNALAARLETAGYEGSGCICIEARRLVDLLKELPDAPMELDINLENHMVKITCPGSFYEMAGVDGTEFPQYSKADEESSLRFELTGSAVIEGIENTIFAVSTEEYRPAMKGIFMDVKEESVTFVSTDTRKLVRYINTESRPCVVTSAIIPPKAATILRNTFSSADVLTIVKTDAGMTVSNENFRFDLCFIKGNFPDYNRVIPKDNPFVLTVDRQQLMGAMRRVGSFINTAIGLVRFTLSPEQLELDSRDLNMNTNAQETLPCSYEGTPMKICFSAPFIGDICSVLQSQEVIIKLSDPARPGVFLPTDNEEGRDILMLLMPMSLGDF